MFGIHIHINIKGPAKWLANAASSAGRSVSHAVAGGISAATGLVGKVPIIGKPLAATLRLAAGPISLGDRIMQGERIDRALVGHFKDQVSSVREIAPYAKMVITFVPGIGTGIGAAFAAGEALASGRPLDAALVAGIKGAVPGGAIGAAAFDVAAHAAKGENIVKAGLSSALSQLPSAAQKAIDIVGRAAAGERVDKIALEEARGQLPPEIRTALDVGIAVGHGAQIQEAVAMGIQSPESITALGLSGTKIIADNPLFQAGLKAMSATAERRHGYEIGMGLLSMSGVNELAITQVREKLKAHEQIGFDIAISTRIGRIRSRPPPKGLKPVGDAAFYATKGMIGGAPQQKAAMMTQIVADADARAGAAAALAQVANARKRAAVGPWLGALGAGSIGFGVGGPIGAVVGLGVGWVSGKVATR
jgi:hypothetical protein